MFLSSRVFACSVVAATIVSLVPAQGSGAPKPNAAPAPAAAKAQDPAAAPKPVYVVVKNADKLEVLTKADLEARNKQLADEFAKATQKFETDKKAAEAAHTEFRGKKPEQTRLEMQPGEFPTREAAEAAMAKLNKPKEDKVKEPAKEPAAPKKKSGDKD